MHLAFTFAAIATAIAVVASALRGRRYLHTMTPVEPIAEELAEGAAESAVLLGLDESAELANGNGSTRNGNGTARKGNGVRAASGAETEAENA
jgi:hypothetical protein